MSLSLKRDRVSFIGHKFQESRGIFMSVTSKIRFAVIGLGHITQLAVLPAFKNAAEKCELTALISSDPEKISKLSKMYGVSHTWSYEGYDEALTSGAFDAIYIALPNDMHKEYAVKAANKGIHVLCEKPLALDAAECQDMIDAAEKNNVKLMTAYRLHFEKTNMTAVDMIKAGKIGTPRVFNSTFTLQVRPGNIRTQGKRGGGPLGDIGIYCINAARYLFQEDPLEVIAIAARSTDPRFAEIEESISLVMKFPGEKLASIVCNFGAVDTGHYQVVGTGGTITLNPGFSFTSPLVLTLKSGHEIETITTPPHDHFAPELLHFAECILDNKQPRPSGYEGMNDLKVMDAIHESITTGRLVAIAPGSHDSKPDGSLICEKPAVDKPELVNVQSPSIK